MACLQGVPCPRRPVLGWLRFGEFPGWWAATVATYCPSRVVEHPKSKSTKPRGHETPTIPLRHVYSLSRTFSFMKQMPLFFTSTILCVCDASRLFERLRNRICERIFTCKQELLSRILKLRQTVTNPRWAQLCANHHLNTTENMARLINSRKWPVVGCRCCYVEILLFIDVARQEHLT